VEAFCLTPVIACLFFVASVLSMLEMQVLSLVVIKQHKMCNKHDFLLL
jgi:hypothetical protein